MKKKECKQCKQWEYKHSNMIAAYNDIRENKHKDKLQMWLNFTCIIVFIILLFAFLVPFSWAETPNWQLFDQRIRPAAESYKSRWQSGSYDDYLANYYYDASNGFEYLSRRYNDPSYLTTAQQAVNFYADQYAIQYNGNLPGYWIFTEGLRKFGRRDAIQAIAYNGAFCRATTAEDTRQTEYSREVAYCIKTFLDEELLGAPRRDRLFTLVAHAQSHLEQWANGNAPYMRGFMFALTARSLIQYHDQVEPLGIRERIQAAASYWKACCWIEGARAFQYTDRDVGNPDDLNPQPDLNLLIAPVYAWLGDTEFAGKVFNGGVEQAWLGNVGNMKQFSQQLLWVEKFQQWAASPIPTPSPTLTVVPTPTASPSPSPIPTPCQKSSTGKLTLKYLDCRVSRIVKMNDLRE